MMSPIEPNKPETVKTRMGSRFKYNIKNLSPSGGTNNKKGKDTMIPHGSFFSVSKNNASPIKIYVYILIILTCFNNSSIIYFLLKKLYLKKGGSELIKGNQQKAAVTLESRIRPCNDVLFKEVGGEAVVLNLETGKYYGLDEVGARMWTLLIEKKQMEAVYHTLVEEFEVSADQLEKDLLSLVDQLANNGLLQVDET